MRGKWIRKIDNKRRAVGILLAVLGGYCFFVGYLFQVIDLIFGLFHGIESAVLTNLLKLFFTFLILIFPTTIIGSIFPITTYLYSVETGKLGKDVALGMDPASSEFYDSKKKKYVLRADKKKLTAAGMIALAPTSALLHAIPVVGALPIQLYGL